MKKVLIVKDTAYAAKIGGGTVGNAFVDGNALIDGAIAFYTEDGRLLTAAGAAAVLAAQPDTKQVYANVGRGNLNIMPDNSGMIDRFENINVVYRAYVAPVAHVIQVGGNAAGTLGNLNPPSSVEQGDEIILRIVDNRTGTIPPEVNTSYSYVLKAGETISAGIDKLVAKVNADANSAVTLAAIVDTGVNVGILVTCKTAGVRIDVAVDGVIQNATIYSNAEASSDSILPVLGNGTYEQVAELERLAMTESGRENFRYLQEAYYSRLAKADSTKTYSIFVIQWTNTRFGTLPPQSGWKKQEVYICVESGAATLITALTTLSGLLFGTTRTNVETGA